MRAFGRDTANGAVIDLEYRDGERRQQSVGSPLSPDPKVTSHSPPAEENPGRHEARV